MLAVQVVKLADPTVPDGALQLVNVPLPTPEDDQVVIEVVAASVNFADVLQAQGLYQERPPLPFIPCSECSGIVVATGVNVTSVSPGDRVVAVTQGGCLAQRAVAHARAVFRVPDTIPLDVVAGLPVAFGTAHLALVQRARIRAGQWVLVLGAAGGVGLAATQIAKLKGCHVVAVARGAEKTQLLRDMGADVVLNSNMLVSTEGVPKENVQGGGVQGGGAQGGKGGEVLLSKAIRTAVPGGVDVVFDPVGGTAFSQSLRCCRWGAHVLVIGFASGVIPKLPVNIALVKNLTMHGIYWGSYMQHSPGLLEKGVQELLEWVQEGRLHVHVSHRFPLHKAHEAYAALQQRHAVGKVLVMVGGVGAKL